MPTDLDGDSQMASSPESTHMDDSPAGSRTPTNKTQFAGAAELSPPGSQVQNPTEFRDISGLDKAGAIDFSTQTQAQQQPGASWMNKRAEEEYQRAMEVVTDKDFNLDEFGDPFDERDMEETLF